MTKYAPRHGARIIDRPKVRLLTALGLTGGLTGLVLAGLVSPASAGTAGDWTSGPSQDLISSTSADTVSTAYQTAVRAPINADGSSNFAAKRGVIPVQFDLLAGTSTVTTTTKTYSPFLWESVSNDASTTNDFTFARFQPTTPIALADLDLSAVYGFTAGTNGGGSLRWSLGLDWTGDGVRDNPSGVYVYYGTYPNFDDNGAQSGVNMRSLTDLRVDTTNAGGTFYDSWTGLAALHPSATVTSASLVMDGGWSQSGGVQRANVSNVQVNGNVFTPPSTTVVTTSDPVLSAFTKTCTLPEAGIKVVKGDNVATGAVNEAESIQPRDSGDLFRQVDCKYIYNLDVSRLTGSGTYRVYATFGGTPVQAPAKFDLK